MHRPTKITNRSNAFRVRQALFLILWSLSTKDLQYLHDLKNWVWNLDFVWVVIDEIIQARNLKQKELYDDIINDINI